MKESSKTGATPTDSEEDFGLLKDLERQSVDEIAKRRAHERIDRKIRLVLQRGDSSRVNEMRLQAYTSNVSSGGCCVVSTGPVGVGDIFRITFDRSQLDVPMVFGRCVRCRLLREDSFEVAFSFFNPVTLAQSEKRPNDNSSSLLG
jgi:hypothetical protein